MPDLTFGDAGAVNANYLYHAFKNSLLYVIQNKKQKRAKIVYERIDPSYAASPPWQLR